MIIMMYKKLRKKDEKKINNYQEKYKKTVPRPKQVGWY